MKLLYTPKSHFARKVRILIDALSLDVELLDAGNVADNSPDIFACNPLMKVPTLIDGKQVVFESDLIAHYIVNQSDPKDQFKVLTQDWPTLNARAVMNGVMSAEVELIMAERSGINTEKYTRFDKLRNVVVLGLEWLEQHAKVFKGQPSYCGFHLVSLWDHLLLYKMFDLTYPTLKKTIYDLSAIDFINHSSPLD